MKYCGVHKGPGSLPFLSANLLLAHLMDGQILGYKQVATEIREVLTLLK